MKPRLPVVLATVAAVSLIGVAVTFAVVVATDDDDDAESLVFAPGLGMMGDAGLGGMMGSGMMYGLGVQGDAEPVGSMQEAGTRVEAWLADAGFEGLRPGEVMAFSNGYYVAVEDAVGEGGFELLVDPATGWISPEPGPNMMWNTQYGMMGGRLGGMMGGGAGGMMGSAGMMGGQQGSPFTEPLSAQDAQEIANRWLEQVLPAETAGEPLAFPGYYTFDTERDGDVQGMLSVNAQTGAVWYHVWHGSFVGEIEA